MNREKKNKNIDILHFIPNNILTKIFKGLTNIKMAINSI